MLLTGLMEMFSLGLVFPFLAILIDQNILWENELISKMLVNLDLSLETNITLPITILFALGSFLANGARLATLWFNAKISKLIGYDLSCKTYFRTLNQPYIDHNNRNSDIILATLTNYIKLTSDSIEYILLLITSSFILIFILFTLFAINPFLASISLLFLVSVYIYIALLFKKKLLLNGNRIVDLSKKQIKIVQESLGGIRDIIINDKSIYYSSIFKKIDLPLRIVEAQNSFIGGFPRYTMEAIAITFIAFISYFMLKDSKSPNSIIPFLGVLALSAQKLLPALQQIFKSWAGLQSNNESTIQLLNLIKKPINDINLKKNAKPLIFKRNIKFRNVSFKYNGTKNSTLNKVNLEIKKGEKLGIIGKTGSGKSTTVDLLMGLLIPTSGRIFVDNKDLTSIKNNFIYSWQKNIAHVPQNIYIADASFAENIAFGLNKNEINIKRLKEVSKEANINDFIESTPYKYNTQLGERGAKISGGQRQRIGIARALYERKSVLILDECTSSLDIETENSIMKSIEKLSNNITIIMVSHRLNTLKKFDRILEINKGQINEINL